uniref:Methyltransferase domain-containing protein n=1 Tax=Romanomermis culicivorax TaxID=13658 RepID=A0A915L9P9_ROMCU
MNFEPKINDLVNYGYAAAAALVGYNAGLFDCLDSTPKTCETLARETKCKSRYVQEWLNAMVCAGIVESGDGKTFSIPEENRGYFKVGSPHMAMLVHLPMVFGAFTAIEKCFKLDGPGGTTYHDYGKFYENTPAVQFSAVIPSLVHHDPSIHEMLENGCQCLDVGCGWGTAIYTLSKLYPKTKFHGIDVIESAIHDAKERISKENVVTNVEYSVMDAAKLSQHWENSFNYVMTFDAVHDQAHPNRALREIFRVLKPGGYYSMVDVNASVDVLTNKREKPLAAGLYGISLFHCMPISLGPKGDGLGLGTMWGKEKAAEMLQEAGFVDVKFYTIGEHGLNYHCVSRRP